MQVAACAFSGEEALAAARRSKPEFVVVDVELGGEDGFELARSLLEQDAALRIVMTSAYEFDELAELAAECGAAGFIPKRALNARAIREMLAR
jgi:two-component system, NarL family, nitrate/nitrite response regulator NarL